MNFFLAFVLFATSALAAQPASFRIEYNYLGHREVVVVDSARRPRKHLGLILYKDPIMKIATCYTGSENEILQFIADLARAQNEAAKNHDGGSLLDDGLEQSFIEVTTVLLDGSGALEVHYKQTKEAIELKHSEVRKTKIPMCRG